MKKYIVIFMVVILCTILALLIIKQYNNPIIIISRNHLFKITGEVEITYKIYKNGDIYMDSYRSNDIEYSEINEHEFQKNISKNELKDIERKLKNLNESEYRVDNFLDSEWTYQINDSNYYVKNINLYQYVLEQYLDENYTQTINKRNLENSIYDFIKENYAAGQSILYTGSFNMFSLTDEEKNIILNEYKKENSNIEISNDELLKIIDDQAFKIWNENTNSYLKNIE